jgi:hypothetical protein
MLMLLCMCRGGFFTGAEFIDMLNEVRHLALHRLNTALNMAAGAALQTAAQPMLTPTWVLQNQL